MVRETSGTATDAVLYPIPLPELGAGLWSRVPYRVRLSPVSRGARRLYVVHVVALERTGHLIRFRHLVPTGKRATPAHLTVPAGRIMAVEPLAWGDRERAIIERQRRAAAAAAASDDAGRKLTLSEGGAKPNAPAGPPYCPNDCDCTHHCAIPCPPGCRCPAARRRDVTNAPRKLARETEHRPGSLADGPAGAAGNVSPAGYTVGAPAAAKPLARRSATNLLSAKVRRYEAPPALALLLVEHRADCLRPDGCELSVGLWRELVAIHGTAAALGAFYAAERWAETRRARVTARAALAIAPTTRKGAHL